VTTRRHFIQSLAAGSGALVLGVRLPAAQEGGRSFGPNAWVRLEADGAIVITVGKSELGQGVRTALPMIVAEELDADFSQVRLEQASPSSAFNRLGTGGSTSLMTLWDPLRQAGAAARAMVVAAAAARWGVPAESCETEASHVLHRPTGRRLAYRELVAEAARQPVPQKPVLKDPSRFRLLGRAQRRLDGPDIVTGRALYGFDVRLPGLLRAVVLRPPVLGARAVRVEAGEALKVPGVKQVLAISRGIAVVADSSWAALQGREALRVEWTSSPHAGFNGAELQQALARETGTPGVTICKDGAGREGFAKATRRFRATYHYPWEAHAAMEPMNATALVTEGRCEIWTPSQAPNAVQAMAAQVLALPAAEVRVHVTLAGGGFGRRLGVDFDTEAVELAKALKGRPVQVLWTREDDLRHGYFQAPSAHHLEAGLTGGRVVAWEHRKASVPHNARRGAPTPEQLQNPLVVIGWAWGIYDTPYAWPAAEMTYRGLDAPTPIGPWRSVFSPSSVFARECFVDEVAGALKRDPVALRLEWLGKGRSDVPRTLEVGGARVERDRMIAVIERARSEAGWGRARKAGRAWGFAASCFHTGTYVAHAVELSLRHGPRPGELPFRVHRVVCAVDCGLVVNPDGVRQQVEGGFLWGLSNLKNEVTFEKGAPVQGSFGDFPIPGMAEAPERIETHLVEGGADRPAGVGEPVVDTVAPAVLNALARLTGKRIRSLPLRQGDLG
jgi:CO/xanthine dehydrogenase Mo-binding subunit